MKRRVMFSRIAWVLTILAATASPTWGQAGSGTPPQSKPRAGQPSIRKAAKATAPLSEADCRAYAETVIKAVSAKDLAALNALIDWDGFMKRMATGWVISNSMRDGAFKGVRKGMDEEHGTTGQLIKNAKLGGSLTFLRTRQNHGQRVVLFRIIQPKNEGINYLEFVLQRSPDGRIRAADIYAYISGEFLTETLRRALMPILADQSRTFLDRLLNGEKDYVHDFPKLMRATQLLNDQSPAEAMGVLKQMHPETRKQKLVLLLRLRAAQATDDKEYVATMEDFRKFYPNDPCLDLILVNSFVMKNDIPGAIKAIDRLDRTVGGDPYLNVLRAGLTETQGDLAGAWQFARKAVNQEPTLITGQLALLGYSLEIERYDEALARLKELDQKFHMQFIDLSQVPEYAGFVKSPQYPGWLAYLKEKKPPKTTAVSRKPSPAAGTAKPGSRK